MSDIARRAGLSQAAVSMALRRHPRIAAATCDRVVALAREMGYRPNPLVSALMSQLHDQRSDEKSPVIAVVNYWPPENDPWNGVELFREFAQGLEDRAEELGYVLEEFRVGERHLSPAALERQLNARGIAGIFVVPLPRTGAIRLTWDRYAMATLGDTVQGPGMHRAAVNQYVNAWKALEVLRERGFRRIALVQSLDQSVRIRHSWLAAYRAWAAFAGRVAAGEWHGPEDPLAVRRWLRTQRVDAVLLHEGFVAEAARGVAPAFDLGCTRGLGLPGVDPCRRAVGATAIDLIVGQLNRNERGLPAHPKTVLIEGVWSD